uniref:Amidohydrolase n=1 Tax=Eiseniibacteriota bacterium TaxID=2212470 RepID=A0A832MM07_UNCEI
MTLPAAPRARLLAGALLAASLLLVTARAVPAHDAASPDASRPALADGGGGASSAAPATRPDATWDVQNPPGPSADVTIDVREGTWMSVDVSPDGREIVFDLLGDLYLLPITGGEARPLTRGPAWDEQPRFSPDGARIAFTSDRGGGDNIWIVNRDGSRPVQVTWESYRLLNSPAWTPDGEYLAARKHFTSTRSAGAGEIWLYHRTGGEGVQMTRRRTDQKDEGEPAFSPDGRWLYWSMDATPGRTFEYNKDANGAIYAIQRLDRETGEITTFAGGPGGAIRPTPSPDGRSVAFIRRVRGASVLWLADVATGAERPLATGLDRDLQESWAIHGVYPGMAWTPDAASIVYWAGGKIRRVEVATGRVREIPFHVRDTRRVQPALRLPVDVAPDSARAKMLRWVSVSPAGDRVAYSALGRVWVRALPNGVPRRLTRQNDHFEFYPSWSRDGRSIVYVSWDDERLGAVRMAPAGGGEGRILTPRPGHYVEPALSPDGRTVVYRALGSGPLTSPAGARETGVFRVPVAGGEPRLVTRRGIHPHFGASSERVFLTEIGGADQDERTVFSVRLDGGDERRHLKGVYFTEARLSPDERWIAFRERYKVFVMPFMRTGGAIDIGPSARNLPLRQVSADAGEFLHWSGDGRALHWTLGPTLYTRELRELFAFAPGAPESLPAAPARGRDVSFSFALDRPAGTLALVGGRIVTMRGDEVIEDGTIVVRGNRIAAVGRRAEVAVPPGARVVELGGRTVIPGLVDAHWHGGMGWEQLIPEQNWIHHATLAFGVTTIHDPSNDSGEIFTVAEMARAGLLVAPRVFSTGTILYGAKGDFRADVDSLGDARMHVQRMKAIGAITVKSYNQPRRDQRQQVLAAAREAGVMVHPEGGALFPHNMTMIVDGHTGIEHALPLARLYDDVVQLWRQTRVAYTPTFNVAYGGLDGEHHFYAKTRVWEDPRLLAFVPRRTVDARARRPVTAPDEEWNHLAVAREAARLRRAGVGVQIGAHGQREGLGAHWELWSLAQGGLTPLEALRCATLGGAEYLGMERDLGSLEPGKLADLAVLERNPLEDIRHSNSVRYVMLNGRLYDAARMDEIAPRARPRAPFWWEESEAALRRLGAY